MAARSMIVGTVAGLAASCVLLTAPAASAGPGVRPGLLTGAQVPGFRTSVHTVRTITKANLASCDTFGPVGGSFSLVTLTGSDAAAGRSFDTVTEGVVHASTAAAIRTTLAGVKSYVARCLASQNGGYTPSGGAPTYTLTTHPIAALKGTGKGVEVVISGSTTVARVGATTVSRLSVPFIAYPAGNNLLFVVPLRYATSTSGKTTTTTISETAALSAVLTKALPVAVRDL